MKEAGSGCRGDRRPCGRQVTVAVVRGTRSWRQRPLRSWPEPTPPAVGLSCDGCRGSGDPAVGLGGWGVSGSRGRRRGGGDGARAGAAYPVFVVMEDLVEKLKLLRYEEELLRKSNLKPRPGACLARGSRCWLGPGDVPPR